jgi:hypothetical protein
MSLGCVAMQAGMLPAEPADRSAAAAGLTFVAGLVGVVEIRAARPLQQVARRRRLVAQLTRGAGQQGTRQKAIVAPHAFIGRKISVADERADAQSAVRRRFDLVQRQPVHVDQVCRRLDPELHEIKQIGASGNELGAWRARGGGGSLRRRIHAFVGEGFHAFLPATSVIASAMFE